MNVLNAMPKSVQAKAKAHLHDIWQAETKAKANAAFDFFIETYGVKWDKAAAKLVKDRDALLTFYDYPAEHWKHVRTSNPIESTFATVRHRTKRTKGCLSRKTGLAMAFKLTMPYPQSSNLVTLREGLRHNPSFNLTTPADDRAGIDPRGVSDLAQIDKLIDRVRAANITRPKRNSRNAPVGEISGIARGYKTVCLAQACRDLS